VCVDVASNVLALAGITTLGLGAIIGERVGCGAGWRVSSTVGWTGSGASCVLCHNQTSAATKIPATISQRARTQP
jgi:hypothetical protein